MKSRKITKNIIKKMLSVLESMQLRKSALLSFFTIVMIPLVIIVLVFFGYSKFLIEKEIATNLHRAAEQTQGNIDYRLGNISETNSTIIGSVYPYISMQNESFASQLDSYHQMKLILSAYNNNSMIDKIRVYAYSEKIYSNQKDVFFPLSDLFSKELFMDNFDNGKQSFLLETYTRTTFPNINTDIISCAGIIASPTNYNDFCSVILLDIPESKICDILDEGRNENEHIYIVNSEGVIISDRNKNLLGTQGLSEDELQQINGQESGIIYTKSHGKDEFLTFSQLESADWFVIIRKEKNNVLNTGTLPFAFASVLAIIAVLIVLSVSLVILYVFILETSFKRINGVIANVRIDDLFSEEDSALKKNSLTYLKKNSIRLVTVLKKSIVETYEAKFAMHEAELKALQAQINPHFLYNTLDAIKWMILDNDTEKSVWMVNSLSKYFRLSINKGKDIVTLREEITLIDTYIGIVKKRFENKFSYSIRYDQTLSDYQLPKLTLQPIVENSILHGIFASESLNGILTICADEVDSDIIIIIEDNGKGISEEEMKKIFDFRADYGGYGLKNVNERLKLIYGNEYGVSIKSTLGKGTQVTVKIRKCLCIHNKLP